MDTAAYIQSLIAKAASAEKSEDAMRFSQAALNAVNAAMQLKALTFSLPQS